MICKQCKQAFNGTAGICHLCGTVHSEPTVVKPAIPEVAAIDAAHDPAKPDEPEVTAPEIKKPAHKKAKVGK